MVGKEESEERRVRERMQVEMREKDLVLHPN